MPSPIHSRAARFVETKVREAIRELLLPDVDSDGLIILHGDGRTDSHSHCLMKLIVGLLMDKFGGEPDGGIGFRGIHYPFLLLETGNSDNLKKTRGRTEHWLLRGKGAVISCL